MSIDATSDFYSDRPHKGFGRIRPPDLEWLARAPSERVIDPELVIVDAQQHLWDRPGNRYLLPDLAADLDESGHRITATVAVESGVMYRTVGPEHFAPVGEVEFLDRIAALSASGGYGPARVASAILGFANLALGEKVGDVLDALQAASQRLRGIRYPTMWDADTSIGTPLPTRRGMLRETEVLRGAGLLARRGLSFDASVFFSQLDDVVHLARNVPDLSIVLGHLGMPLGYGAYIDRKGEVHELWKRGMTELAELPNVSVKLGGMVLRFAAYDYTSGRPPAHSSELARLWGPYITETIELFGPARCMFESNFPADKAGVTYRIIWNTFKRIVRGASDADKALLFAGTARRTYGVIP